MRHYLIVCAAALSLAACATPTVYGPSTGPKASGFSDYRIESGRYRVTFQGGNGAPPAQVDDFALRRAAEVVLRDGYDWFRVVNRIGEQGGGGNGPRIGLGVGGGGGGYRSGVGVGLGTSFDLSGGPAYRQTLEVLAGKGTKPEGAYDARSVAGGV
jgi:hypothetical protein